MITATMLIWLAVVIGIFGAVVAVGMVGHDRRADRRRETKRRP